MHITTPRLIILLTLGGIMFWVGYTICITYFSKTQTYVPPPYLVEESDSVVPTIIEEAETPLPVIVPPPPLHTYIEIIDGCGPSYTDECAVAYGSMSTNSPALTQLRKGMVLEVGTSTILEGTTWYTVLFNEFMRYPERVTDTWYIPLSTHTRFFENSGAEDYSTTTHASTTKYIIVDRSDQRVYAYDDKTLIMTATTSTGIGETPTPRGTFTVYRKTPSRYMQGPIAGISTQYYDLPGVPWNLYFSEQGAVIHGAYWHNKFGQPWSHGCVNLPPDVAEKIYTWAPLGTKIIVRD